MAETIRRSGNREVLERIDRLFQMPARQMEIDAGRFQVGVAEQYLNGGQIRSVFQQMRGEAVAEGILVLLMICTPRGSAIAITRDTEQQFS
jgi:hypothetical protein